MKHLATTIVILILATTNLTARNINVAAIDSFINHIECYNQGIGSVAVAHNGNTLYTRDFGKGAVAPHNNIYQIGSITKLFTATIIHRLCAEGKLSLDTTLDTFFPHIASADSITIRQMLNHTSGLADYTIKQDSLVTWLSQPATQQEILDEITRQGIIFEPGTGTRYSNTAYYLLGQIIEQLYHTPYHSVVDSIIARPLNLCNTKNAINVATQPAPSYRLNTANRWQQIDDFYFPNVTAVGDISSTTHDLITFINAIFNGSIADSTSLSVMLPQAQSSFGCGLMLLPFYQHIFYGHAGDTYGTHTVIMHNPADSISIALALNGCSAPRNDLLIGIASAIYDTPYEYPDYSELQQYTPSATELAQYEGSFNSSLINLPMYITYNPIDGNLSLQLKGQPALWLEAKRPGVFVNSPTGSAISFKDKDRFIFKQFGRIIIYTRQ
ncbi:MAG: beta-lactamase family protein [Bacteroidaceae bacterium]|nr:beta-lactamase family protein [Bacteroidaceae bacterium]